MHLSEIFLCGIAFLLLAKSRESSHAQVRRQYELDYLNDPTNWGSDMWARIYGADITLGAHPAPSGYDQFGMRQVGFQR